MNVSAAERQCWPPERNGCTHPQAEKRLRPPFGAVPMRKCYSFPGTTYKRIPLGYVCVSIWHCPACDTYWREDEGGQFHEANRYAEMAAYENITDEYPGIESLDGLPAFLAKLGIL